MSEIAIIVLWVAGVLDLSLNLKPVRKKLGFMTKFPGKPGENEQNDLRFTHDEVRTLQIRFALTALIVASAIVLGSILVKIVAAASLIWVLRDLTRWLEARDAVRKFWGKEQS